MRNDELRAELAALLLEAGPDHPTLCAGWTTRDLAAHLMLREHRLSALPGIAIGPLARYTAGIQQCICDEPFTDVVATFAAGPSALSPFRVKAIGAAANIAEFSIHREDIRRAEPGWAPLQVPDQDALWQRLAVMGRFTLRRSPVRILAVRSDGPGQREFGRGAEQIVMRGAPLELLLRLTGRTQADVEVFGSDRARDALSHAAIGL